MKIVAERGRGRRGGGRIGISEGKAEKRRGFKRMRGRGVRRVG